jgi:hypothetical protein
MEGSGCVLPGCDLSGKVLPTLEYAHADEGACCVIGGYVYRGSAMPGLRGRYFYGDYCGRWVRSFRLGSGGKAQDEREWPGLATDANILSFGEDAAGELYVCTENGKVYRIVDASVVASAAR